ncbi:ABC transporter ATP-binding protein [Thalassotalea atypica]|uniref:ABC transporter ATP-binding protein n=1 Tax=Thalassotalea atypica TaxID=2054316 RepID=UPI00257364EF|nr:ABC transporter ATP-binding protein [Thalassotalea atypica]
MSVLLSVTQLSWQSESVKILRNISFDVEEGEVVGIIGPNGAGKTSLLHCILRQIDAYTGQITLEGQSTKTLSLKQLAHYFALVSQQPSSIFDLSVFDVVRMGLMPHKNLFERDTPEDYANIEQALSKVGLTHASEHLFNQLSGGEQQRALIARALVQKSKVLVLDEPTNHLDVYYQHQILSLVKSLGITVLMTVHDLNLAAQYCQRLILLEHGQIRCDGNIDEVLNEQMLSDVFGLSCIKTTHPIHQVPQISFYPDNNTQSRVSSIHQDKQQASVQPILKVKHD